MNKEAKRAMEHELYFSTPKNDTKVKELSCVVAEIVDLLTEKHISYYDSKAVLRAVNAAVQRL